MVVVTTVDGPFIVLIGRRKGKIRAHQLASICIYIA